MRPPDLVVSSPPPLARGLHAAPPAVWRGCLSIFAAQCLVGPRAVARDSERFKRLQCLLRPSRDFRGAHLMTGASSESTSARCTRRADRTEEGGTRGALTALSELFNYSSILFECHFIMMHVE